MLFLTNFERYGDSAAHKSCQRCLIIVGHKPAIHTPNSLQGSCQRCFKGHSGPVSALSDKLLGDGVGKVLASGGEDGTVRLWSLSSSGKRGQHSPKATLYGHGKPIKLMSVAGYELVS